MNAVRIKIRRQDKPGSGAYWESFEVPRRSGMNVTALLMEIRKRPVNHHGEAVSPVVWDDGCGESDCGACTMLINGRPRPACETFIDALEQPIRLEPLSKFQVVRDLIVDRSSMFDALKRVKAWVELDGTYDAGQAPRVTIREALLAQDLSRCTSCGACLEVCPQYGPHAQFIGAAAISQARLTALHPIAKAGVPERLDTLMEEGGVEDCGHAQNCVKACPVGIPLTESIAAVKREATKRAFHRFFG